MKYTAMTDASMLEQIEEDQERTSKGKQEMGRILDNERDAKINAF
jgi:hypothetical protein